MFKKFLFTSIIIAMLIIAIPAHSSLKRELVINESSKTCKIWQPLPHHYLPEGWEKFNKDPSNRSSINKAKFICDELGFTLESGSWDGKMEPYYKNWHIAINVFLGLPFVIFFIFVIKHFRKKPFKWHYIPIIIFALLGSFFILNFIKMFLIIILDYWLLIRTTPGVDFWQLIT